MVEQKDIIVTMLGASSGLAGLVLVFLGMTVTTIQSYDSETPDPALRHFRVLGTAVGVCFFVGVATVALCVLWLAGGQGQAVYASSVTAFIVQIVLLAVSAAWALLTFVWKA